MTVRGDKYVQSPSMLIIGRSFIPHGAILVSCVLYLEESSGNVRGMRNLELLRFVQQTESVTENNRSCGMF